MVLASFIWQAHISVILTSLLHIILIILFFSNKIQQNSVSVTSSLHINSEIPNTVSYGDELTRTTIVVPSIMAQTVYEQASRGEAFYKPITFCQKLIFTSMNVLRFNVYVLIPHSQRF
jgi:hypothetical protein